MSTPIRVAIVEDEPELRDGWSFLINRADGFQCVGIYESAESFLEQLDFLETDVVLMDIQLPGLDGIACTKAAKNKRPNLQVMMLTVFDEPDRVFNALAAGATGYILKKTASTALLDAIRDLHQGGSPMSGAIARKVVGYFSDHPPALPSAQHEAADAATPLRAACLSPREHEIVEKLARGRRYKEIADELGIAIDTVRSHIRRIYEKLQVQSAMEAVNKVTGKSS